MEILASATVYRNPHPATRSQVAAASSLCWSGGRDGHLMCAFRVGEAKMSPDGRVVLSSSRDLGRTWQLEPAIFDEVTYAAGFNLTGMHLGSDGSGTTILACSRMAMAAPEDAEWSSEAAGIVDADALTIRRAGPGWEAPAVLDRRRHPDEWAIPCGPPLALGSGGWILPMERHARTHEPGWLRRYHAFAAVSEDDGRRWPLALATLNDPYGRLAYYDQRMTVLADGRLLTLAWVHDVVADRGLPARAAVSADGGRSWSEPWDTGIIGGPLNPITLPDGRVLAVYNRRTTPTGIRALVSTDGGRTWPVDEEFVIYDEMRRTVVGEPARRMRPAAADAALWDTMWLWTFGTPTPVELPDRSIGVSFFAMGFDGVTGIQFVRLSL